MEYSFIFIYFQAYLNDIFKMNGKLQISLVYKSL